MRYLVDHPIGTLAVAMFVMGWIMYRLLRTASKEPPTPKDNHETTDEKTDDNQQ